MNIRDELKNKGYRFIVSFEEYKDALDFVDFKVDNEIIMIKDDVTQIEVFEVWIKNNL